MSGKRYIKAGELSTKLTFKRWSTVSGGGLGGTKIDRNAPPTTLGTAFSRKRYPGENKADEMYIAGREITKDTVLFDLRAQRSFTFKAVETDFFEDPAGNRYNIVSIRDDQANRFITIEAEIFK